MGNKNYKIKLSSDNKLKLSPGAAGKMILQGDFNFPVITRGSNNSSGAAYSVDGGSIWENMDLLETDPIYTLFPGNSFAYSQLSSNLMDVLMFSWVTTSGPTLKHLSHDGGKTWVTSYSTGQYQYAHWNKSSNKCYFGGWAGESGYSTDNGETITSFGMNSGAFDSSDDEAYVFGTGLKQIRRSTDQGDSWQTISAGVSGQNHTSVKCTADGQYVFAYYGAYGRSVNISTDYGQSFTELSDADNGDVGLFRDGTLFIHTAPLSSKIYISTDQGGTWISFPSPFGTAANRIFIDGHNKEAYFTAVGSTEIYKLNSTYDGAVLIGNTEFPIGNIDISQYGRGFLYRRTSTPRNLYFSRNGQLWKQIYEGDNSHYLMVL